MTLCAKTLRSRLHTRIVGERILCLDTCTSTNDRAWQEALSGAPEGTAIFAEEQTQGRGRFGRVWFAPRGTCVLCSIILRPTLEAERVPLVTAIAALAVADAVDELAGVHSTIRFPNDVLVDGKKMAGVLVESRFISSRPDLFIVGVGLNVNIARSEFPKELRETATSLMIERGKEVNRTQAARALMESLDRSYRTLEGSIRDLRRLWRERSAILGRRVRLREAGRTYTGTVADVDPLDGIELRLETGHIRGFRGEHLDHLELLVEEPPSPSSKHTV